MTNTTGTGTITTIHLILIALLAIAAIAVIVYGMRLKRARKAADEALEQRAVDAGMPPPVAPSPAAPSPAAPSPAVLSPVAPPPSPLADGPPIAASAAEPQPLADEPIAAAAPLDASPATLAVAPAPTAGPSPANGPVTQLKGLGPKLADKLAELGVTTVGQIAALDEDQAQALDARLGAFTGRLSRDRWIEQARFLAAGDRAGFEAVFGRL